MFAQTIKQGQRQTFRGWAGLPAQNKMTRHILMTVLQVPFFLVVENSELCQYCGFGKKGFGFDWW